MHAAQKKKKNQIVQGFPMPTGQSVQRIGLPQQFWSGLKIHSLLVITDTHSACPLGDLRQLLRPWASQNSSPAESHLGENGLARPKQTDSTIYTFGPVG